MQIEESFAVMAPAEQIYGALISPTLLTRAIPGCERLIQLGPSRPDGGATFEARVRSEEAIWVLTLRTRGGRQHNRVEFSLRAVGNVGHFDGHGSLTLVRSVGKTQLAVDLTVDGPDENAPSESAIHEVVWRFGESLTIALEGIGQLESGERERSENITLAHVESAERIGLPHIGQRAVWMASGLLVGVAALALVSSLARRLASREQ